MFQDFLIYHIHIPGNGVADLLSNVAYELDNFVTRWWGGDDTNVQWPT